MNPLLCQAATLFLRSQTDSSGNIVLIASQSIEPLAFNIWLMIFLNSWSLAWHSPIGMDATPSTSLRGSLPLRKAWVQ